MHRTAVSFSLLVTGRRRLFRTGRLLGAQMLDRRGSEISKRIDNFGWSRFT